MPDNDWADDAGTGETGTAAPPAAPAASSWDTVFAGMSPEDVRKQLDDSRKWEGRAKANKTKADQLDALTEQSQTAEQKAAAAGERAERLAAQYVTAKLEAALTGIVPDAAAVVADLRHERYVTAEGEIDPEKVTELQARYRAMAPAGPRAPAPNPAQGTGQPPKSLAELVDDAQQQAQASGSRQDMRRAMRLQSAQLIEIRSRQQG